MKKTCVWLFLLGFCTHNALSADQVVHPQIEVGASYLLTQDVIDAGVKKGTYSPRLDAYGRNAEGGMIFAIGQGPKQHELPGKHIVQTIYALNPDACIVDVMNGMALMNGAGCNRPLPKHWTIQDRRNSTYACELMQPEKEHIVTAAGEFDATKIECRETSAAPNKQLTATYWYVPSIGSMVKAVHRAVDADGTELYLIREQLVEYHPTGGSFRD